MARWLGSACYCARPGPLAGLAQGWARALCNAIAGRGLRGRSWPLAPRRAGRRVRATKAYPQAPHHREIRLFYRDSCRCAFVARTRRRPHRPSEPEALVRGPAHLGPCGGRHAAIRSAANAASEPIFQGASSASSASSTSSCPARPGGCSAQWCPAPIALILRPATGLLGMLAGWPRNCSTRELKDYQRGDRSHTK